MNATARPPDPAYEPHLHDVVEDTAARKIGKVIGFVGPYVEVRPVGGGVEWDAKGENLRPVSGEEALRAGVALANARSRGVTS